MIHQKHKGFTLLELMVAISIFAVISLLTMGGLSNILDTRAQTEESLQRLTRFQMLFTVLSRELQQFSNRSVRDEYGAFIDSMSSETSEGVIGIEFTHHGRFLLGEQSSLQRVAYYLEDNKVIKKIWNVLDRVEDTKPVKQILINKVNELEFSFFTNDLQQEGQWQEDINDKSLETLRAVKVSFKTDDLGEVYRIFEVLP